MGLADIVRSGVAIINGVTASLQPTVQHWPWVGQDVRGNSLYGAPIARQALVEQKQRMTRNPAGEDIMQYAQVTFIGPIEANGAADRKEPIDPRDKMILPDGYTGSIINVTGLVDPGGSNPDRPYLYEVSLG